MCVSTCVRACVRAYVCVFYVCPCANVCASEEFMFVRVGGLSMHTCACILVRMYICVRARASVCVCVCVCVCVLIGIKTKRNKAQIQRACYYSPSDRRPISINGPIFLDTKT